MELYRIENDYKNHKKRLESIRNFDSKQKIRRITSQHFYQASELKRIKLQDHTFHQREEKTRREHSLSLMNKTITDRSRRIKQQYEASTTIVPLQNKTARNSSLSNEKDSSHVNELAWLQQKIQHMKSIYQKYRRKSDLEFQFGSALKAEKERTKKSEKDKVIQLLKEQFKIEPTVVFPKCRARPGHLASEPGLQKKER